MSGLQEKQLERDDHHFYLFKVSKLNFPWRSITLLPGIFESYIVILLTGIVFTLFQCK